MQYPVLIQGGMGAGVSGWRLARTVSMQGQLGVVAGTALDAILIRRLQEGDPGGHFRRALATFPFPEVSERVLDRYFIPGGKADDEPYRLAAQHSMRPSKASVGLTVLANYAEIWLAKEGHDGVVGVNYLEKIQLPNTASIYGAMLAGIDYVLMGAGIPREIPGILDDLAAGRPTSMRIAVEGEEPGDEHRLHLDPQAVFGDDLPEVKRPLFLAIIASTVLASALVKRSTGMVDGFVVEGPVAGGHNAPPRGRLTLDDSGQPLYGPRDEVKLAHFRKIGRPFWLAGAYGRAERIAEALAEGATGVQVGTPFAFCEESGLDPELRTSILEGVRAGTVDVFTDPVASPTGFPFKVVRLEGSLSELEVYEERTRICDLGYLRTAYLKDNGHVAFRCPSEPLATYEAKGGDVAETEGRKCVCNGLVSNLGLGQVQKDGAHEPPIFTSGEDLSVVLPFLTESSTSYSAVDVVNRLCRKLQEVPS
jgi:nitronate monooxygenase